MLLIITRKRWNCAMYVTSYDMIVMKIVINLYVIKFFALYVDVVIATYLEVGYFLKIQILFIM